MKWSNLNWKGKFAAVFLGSLISLAIIGLVLGIFTSLGILGAFRIILGIPYVLFLPGFLLTFIFFPLAKHNQEKSIDYIERIALSFALSIAIVPLVIFYLHLIGLQISALNSFFTILGIIIIESVAILLKNRI